jgi:murein DD-endopeptidase MepM/ murein hydrolase activator NlpD
METAFHKVKRVLFIVYLLALHLLLIYFGGAWILSRYATIGPVETAAVNDPTERKVIPTPLPVPESFADTVETNVNADSNTQPLPETVASPGLIIPVVGVRPDQLIDTFSASRSEGRSHDAIDIPASAGTPVVAAADGEIVKFFDSDRGGITIYQLTADKKFMLYYAHLQKRAEGISVGMTVRKGTTIGFVGDTGNAGAGNFHLHFSMAIVTDPKRFWSGTYINPYPLLKNGEYPR